MASQPSSAGAESLYYDLVSTLHHSLQAEQAYTTYIKDAQASGNKEAADFFQQQQQHSQQCAEKARQMLVSQAKH